ncbi:spermatogenesis-associated protein 6 isoform X1 [Maniola jurtina]|uniref:spermatogenesis-associated protein 6 isoform X1 n=1 Tax=Maniola jurtina TaxID=191418 RepID=UPI001E68A6A5|nr:spermatogenesis-associated protein 6 isoform X1 [Maniola jurtina]
MPKLIELTIEIEVQKVSCPGVWLCQDGRVSLTIFALGTSYQTCLLPPCFPLAFRDVFYFRKRFQESCALNNICCLLKDETIYCELVQWCENCVTGNCIILAQYLGAMNDVLFPPNMCSSDGVDLLMRRSKDFPGILSPKIEISTKVRIDEVWNSGCMYNMSKADPCYCGPKDLDGPRQKQVCHSAQYHRTCHKNLRSRSRSRSRSIGSRSCCSVEADVGASCRYPNPLSKSRVSLSPCAASRRRARPCREYNVYPVDTGANHWRGVTHDGCDYDDDDNMRGNDSVNINSSTKDERLQKLLLESRYIDQDVYNNECTPRTNKKTKLTPCVCEICRKYHELFHNNTEES